MFRGHPPQPATLRHASSAGLLLFFSLGAAVGPCPSPALAEDLDARDAVAAATTEGELVAAIELLTLDPRPGASRLLVELIRRGIPGEALLRAIDGLLLLDEPRVAGPVLLELMSHRRAEARRRAVTALVELRPRGVEAALRSAVGDLDREVRETAMLGLGRLGDRSAVPVLFAALERGANRALVPLSRLIGDDDVPRILDRLGRTPLERLGPALRVLAGRGDLSEETRVSVVAALGELGTAGAREILEGVAEELPPRGVETLRSTVEDALRRLPGS